ncbi:putative ribonuclease H-like domain-containing protein [Tanacetum coccineum]
MDLETTQTNVVAKMPLLKQENGNSFKPTARTTANADGTSTSMIPSPVTTKEKAQKKNDVKARSILLMALPNEHQFTFNQYKDAKTLFAAIQTRFGGNVATKKTQKTLLKQSYENFNAPSTESLDSIFNRLQKIVSQYCPNLSNATVYAFLANQPNGSQLVHEDLEKIHEDDLEEMDLKWQLALLSMRARKYYQRTRKNITINGSDTAGYDKSKKRKWNTNMDLGAFSDSEVYNDKTCSNTCLKTFKALKTQLDNLRVEFNKSEFNLATYKTGLASVEEQLVFYKKNEVMRKGVSRNVVPPPPTGLFAPSIIDLSYSGLEEFQQPEFEGYGPKTSKSVCVDTLNEEFNEDMLPLEEESGSKDHWLGHVNFKTINKLVKDNLVRGLPSKRFENDQTCVACLKEKQHKASCLTFMSSLMNKKYCLVVTDDYSRFTWVFFLASKDETSGILKNFITEIENLVDKKVKIIRCENGTEFKNRVMNEFCEKKGIKREYSVARTPQQNGVAERRNRTLIEEARTMVIIVKPHNKTPYELFRDHLGKFDRKSDDGFFVGYSLTSKAFRVYNIRTRKVDENLHIRFLEDKPIVLGDGPKWLYDLDSLTKSMNYVPVIACTNSNDFASSEILALFDSLHCNVSHDEQEPSCDAEKKDDERVSKESEVDNQEKPEGINPNINTAGPTINTASANLKTNIFSLRDNVTPEATNADLFGDEAEMDMSNLNASYHIPTTPNTRIHKDHSLDQVIGDIQSGVQTRGMTKTSNEQGLPIVAYERKPHEDLNTYYDEVFSPVARIEAIRLFLAYASFMGFMVYQMDVKSSFLYGQIKEEVYVCQPPGFENPDYPNKVYKVVKALYGLHQAPRPWYETLAKYLLENGFHRGKIDQTLFIKKQKEDILLVHIYVDDIIFGSIKKELCLEFKKLMHDKFQMSSIGELTFFLGLQVKQKEDGIFISQDKYAKHIEYLKLNASPLKHVKRGRDTKISQSSGPPIKVGDEVVIRSWWWDRCNGKGSTTAFCLEATGRTRDAQTWFEAASKQSNDPPLSRVNTLGSEEDNMKLMALMAHSTARTTDDGEVEITASIDGQVKTITEASLRRRLKLEDSDGITSLPNTEVFEQLALIGKLFSNMKRASRGYSGVDFPLFPTMITTPESSLSRITSSPSLSPQTYQSPQSSPLRDITRQDADIPQFAGGAATTDIGLEASQGSGTMHKTPTRPHDLPLPRVHTLRSDEGSLQQNELMDLVTKLTDRVEVLENDMHKIKKKKVQPEQDMEYDFDVSTTKRFTTASIPVTTASAFISTASATPKKKAKKKLEQERLGHEEAIRLQEQINEEEKQRIDRDEEIAKRLQEEFDRARQEQEVVAEADQADDIDWSDPVVLRYHALQNRSFSIAEVRKNMCMYLKNQGGYKQSHFKGMTYEDIRLIFERVWDQNNAFVPKDFEIEKEVMKRPRFDFQQKSSKKRLRKDSNEDNAKKQKLEDDAEKKELRDSMDVVPRDDIAIDVESLATKYLIVDWKTHVRFLIYTDWGNKKGMIQQVQKDMTYYLWGDLKILFEPNKEDEIWKNQQDYNLIS